MFEPDQVPDYVRKFQEKHANIPERTSVPSLSYEGKQWATVINGVRTPLMTVLDGEQVPAQTVRMVIIGVNKYRGRALYEGAYDPKNIGRPVCWSEDSIAPHPSVQEKKSPKCNTCYFSARNTGEPKEDGSPTTKCSQHRLLAVVPASSLHFTPMRLKISITSEYDALAVKAMEDNRFAFSQYTDFLAKKGFHSTANIITKISFDHDSKWPKVFFSPERFLNSEEGEIVDSILATDVVKRLLTTYTPNGVDGEVVDPEKAADPFASKSKKTEIFEDAVFQDIPPAAKKAKPVVEEDPPFVEEVKAAPKKTKPIEAKTVQASPEQDKLLQDLTADWD
jgi:hypothetical protein